MAGPQRARVFRIGDKAAIASIIDDPDFEGVVNTTLLDAEAAIAIGEALVAIGREILTEVK